MRRIPAQKKKEAVIKALSGKTTIAEVSREYNISRKTLYSLIKIVQKSSDKSLKLLTPRYVRGYKHPRAKYPLLEEKLLRIVVKHPKLSINSLTRYVPLSVWTTWKILEKHNLNTQEKRILYSYNYKRKNLYAYKRKEAVLHVVNNGERITDVAKRYGIARKTLYTWIQRYRNKQSDKVEIFKKEYVRGKDHPLAVYPRIEEKLLLLVANNPFFSISQLSESLNVSVWTIWNILNRYQLSNREKRILFAKKLLRRRQEKVPVITVSLSFSFIEHRLKLLYALTRKIPKALKASFIFSSKKISLLILDYYFAFIASFKKRLISLKFSILQNIDFFVDFAKALFVKTELENFSLRLIGYFRDSPSYLFYYSLLILFLIFAPSFIREEEGYFLKQSFTFSEESVKKGKEQFSEVVYKSESKDLIVRGKTNYLVTEKPLFTVQKKIGLVQKTQSSLSKVLGVSYEIEPEEPKVNIFDSSGTKVSGFKVIKNDIGEYEIRVDDSSGLRPGEYTLNFESKNEGLVTKKFSWGIAALNVNKSSYKVGEEVLFAMSVMDSQGKPYCDANLLLIVENKDLVKKTILATFDGSIKVNDECKRSEKTNKADYEAKYIVTEKGDYKVSLIFEKADEMFELSSDFVVNDLGVDEDFEVSRGAPIRVGPGEDYPVVIKIKANRNYKGKVKDILPKNFYIKPYSNFVTSSENQDLISLKEDFVVKENESIQEIIWDVDFIKGKTYTLRYTFSDLGSDWTNYYLGPVVIDGKGVDRVWEIRPDLVMPKGKFLASERYGNLKLEERILNTKDKTIKVSMPKVHFRADEVPEVKIEEVVFEETVGSTQSGVLQKILGLSNEKIDKPQKDSNLKLIVEDIDKNVELEKDIELKNLTLQVPISNIKPGKHVVTVRDNETGNFVEQTFLYGVLALNLNKTVFAKGETAYIQMASLGDDGHTVCDSNLELLIVKPNGEVKSFYVEDGSISISDYCLNNNVTDKPDYFVYYELKEIGNYHFFLTNLANGFSINGAFTVEEDPVFSLERVGATRINPYKSSYTMKIVVESKSGFSGTLIEKVPQDFQIKEGNYTITEEKNEKFISWILDVTAKEKKVLAYEYQAPKLSPFVFLLGPLEMISMDAQQTFRDTRQWQLASDATVYITSGTSWTVPNDWNDNDNSIEVVGGGGGGANGTASSTSGGLGGGGGGGGGYSKITNLDLTPNSSVSLAVGSGGSVGSAGGSTYFNGSSCASSSVCATGGGGGSGTNGGSGGVASVGSGYSGGNGGSGGAASTNAGGGGGGGGGAGGLYASGNAGNNGSAASGNTGGAGGSGGRGDGSYGGIGGSGGPASSSGGAGGNGSEWDSTHGSGGGGGGGGGGSRNNNGGGGGTSGQYGAGGAGGGGSGKGYSAGSGSSGKQGIIVIQYTPLVNQPPSLNIDEPDGVNDVISEGSVFTIQYDLSDGDNTVYADFYYDTDGSGLDGTAISSCQDQPEGSNQTCDWDTTGVSPGTYYIYGITSDGINPQVSDYSEGVVTINAAPEVVNVVLNSGLDIDLTPNSSKAVNFTATVSDENGFSDIDVVEGKVYRSGVGKECVEDLNNCYYDSSCTLSGCSGNSCTATCEVSLAFFSDATDSGNYSSEYWLAWIKATDVKSESGENISPSDVVDVNSLLTISTSSSIAYGKILPTKTSGLKQTPVENHGNRTLDLRISGDDMCTDYPDCLGDKINVDNQEYDSSSFIYGEGNLLSKDLVPLDIDIPKSQVIPSNSSKNVYWILGIPQTTPWGNYYGSNTIVSIVSP